MGTVGGTALPPRRASPGFALATHAFLVCRRDCRVPIELVEMGAIEPVRRRRDLAGGLVALRGWSRGGELALLTASLVPAVAAQMPRCYASRWNGRRAISAIRMRRWPDARGGSRSKQQFRFRPRCVADPDHPTSEDLARYRGRADRRANMLVSGAADTGLLLHYGVAGCWSVMRRSTSSASRTGAST